jgi:hypothetical protein
MGTQAPANDPPLPGNDTARALLSIALLMALALVAILWPAQPSVLGVWVAYALPVATAVCLVLAIRLTRQGLDPVPPFVAIPGCALLLGAAGFDVVATLLHSPDLSREGNPVIRVLLDSGHSSRSVLIYGLSGQALYLSCLCLLWIAFLRHRTALVGSVRGQPTFGRFLKAATGGAGLSWRQWLLPLRWSELPAAYHYLWVLAVVLWSAVVDRLFLGLEWFSLVPPLRWQVAVAGMAAGLVVYFGWLWRASRTASAEVPPLPADRPGGAE